MNTLSFICILAFSGRSLSQEQTYVITAPKIFRVSASEKVVIQAFGYEAAFPVSISIKSFPDKRTTYASGHAQLSPANKFQGSVTLTIQPKDLPRSASSVLYVYLEASSSHFTREKKMPVTYKNGFLFIQTDKPIYTPDQSVKVRVYSLDEELKPARRETVLTFVDPEGVKVDIIEEEDFTGILSFPDFKIPSNPKYGIWKVEAKYKKSFTTSAVAKFEVKEYAMPSFFISIEPEKNIISSEKFETFRITIKARYFYNKKVARADVYMRFGIIEGTEKRMMKRAMHVTEIVDGVAEVDFNSKNAVKEIDYQSLEELDGSYLYITVTVLESTGGLNEESEFAGVRYALSPYKLNLVATPLFVKPGLPFFIKVQVKDTLDQPVGNLPVILSANVFDEQMDSTKLVQEGSDAGTRQTSVNDGTALFVVNIPSASKALEFQLKTADTSLSEENQATGNYEAKAYSSLSKSYLYIDWASNYKLLHVGDYMSIKVYPHSHYIHKIHRYSYLVQLLSKEDSHKPGTVISINMKTQFSSFVALSSIDEAIYGITGTRKRSMERVMLDLENSDLGCGAGGGQNNVDVFRSAGLTFLTNANADDSKVADESCKAIVRPRRASFEEEIKNKASRYLNSEIRKCCMAGVKESPLGETCDQRVERIKSIPRCINAFKDCCKFATKLRESETHKVLILARIQFKALLGLDKPGIRSYFPESWLWEVHQVPPGSKALSVTLPDSLTTWEIQGVGISDKGICVADALQVQVLKDVFLSMHIPYSVVRGEQIELKGSVYNYRNSKTMFCVKATVGDGICLFKGSASAQQGLQSCKYQNLGGYSVASVTFRILPLELGLHTINFTLLAEQNSEVLVKTLRVVPEGIKRELHAGFSLDPQGVYGVMRRRQEFRHRTPLDLVPKTKVDRIVSIKGQLMGEVISAVLKREGVQFLTNLPKGSAEAELMSIAPVFYVFHYLEKSDNWNLLGPETITSRVTMRRKMKEGIVSILSFRNRDFSYTMWKDGTSSTWLTAFALRIFGQVSQYITLDQISVCNSLIWLIENCQMTDGSFKELSSYQPVKLQGTLPKEAKEKTLYLTAFSVIGLAKAIHLCPTQKIQEAKNAAEEYLLKNVQAAQSTFTLAIAAYALALMDSNHPGTRSAFSALKKEALVKGDPPVYRFWKDTSTKLDKYVPNAGTAQIVETTAYALLTTLLSGDKVYANPVIRWLAEEQRYGGGFYSTQDTINALEALTEYSLLVQRLSLNMDVKVAYKNYGDIRHYKLTEENYIARTVEAPLYDDIYVSTGSSTGLATVNVRTVYHKFSTSEETCNFELKVNVLTDKGERRQDDDQPERLEACAKYKPSVREPQSGSSHAVMDITLVSGVEANTEDLSTLASGVDQLITNYEIKDGHIVLQIDSVPANKFLCVAFRIGEIYRVGMRSPATFTVYEYHAPDKQCTIFYNPYGNDKLLRLCEGAECKCMEAECSQMQKKLDLTITADRRREAACQQVIAYVYKVNILSSSEEGSFIKYTATLLDLYKRGEAFAQKNTEITLVKKKTCTDVRLNPGNQYLIMGKEAFQITVGFSFKYQYPLDSMTWIEWWPSNTACASCKKFVDTMEEFCEELFINGC
ncbi:complement C5 isoform X2 [Malaclemys terrapin pileata]|uniref:complement C5 isoform X2 n=1 Tax=Malaclemys terrapin pileata TaxID=2991368 RepID=UPI0023A8EEF0|nr:complement C5 isoform X2 [Malaclemys terrapin pileata]